MKIQTRLLLGYLVVFVVMILNSVLSNQSTQALIANQALHLQTQEEKTKVRLLMRNLVDMQTGVRGYALTGNEEFLEPFFEGEASYRSTLTDLKQLIDDPAQQLQIIEIEILAETWQQEVIQPVLQARLEFDGRVAGADMSRIMAAVTTQTDRLLMDSIRESVLKFIDQQDATLTERDALSRKQASQTNLIVLIGTGLAVLLGLMAMLFTSRSILRQVGGEPQEIAMIAEQITRGNLEIEFGVDPNSFTGIRAAIGHMLLSLRKNRHQTHRQDWLKTGIARLNGVMSGDPGIETLSSQVICEVATYIDAQVGALYLAIDDGEPRLSLLGSYAYKKRRNMSSEFKLGEGLVGQSALEKQQILVKNIPDDYIKVTSGLGEHSPRFICVTPFLYEGRVKGVIEIATLDEITDRELEYLELAMPALAVAVESAESRTNLQKSLEESKALSEELQVQQEELQTANEEMEVQTQRLEESEEKLKSQQEELQVINEELEERNELLAKQKREVERASSDLEVKAKELAIASRYKSEFLANMSHELRTPLNSLLLLAQSLSANKTGNLTAEEVESARIIHSGGSDLLSLINDILDLSRIEAGRVDLKPGSVLIQDIVKGIHNSFGQIAREKDIGLEIVVNEDAPSEITSDYKRVEQVIRNLVSNAIKFSESGSVSVTFGRPDASINMSRNRLTAGQWLAVIVKDTGIGISPDQQKIIFEAFQQVDGGTGRRYGGTGLGLSISRELTQLLKGEILLESELGKGSTFTLLLPLKLSEDGQDHLGADGTAVISQFDETPTRDTLRLQAAVVQIGDDRGKLEETDQVILVIEDDENFARLLNMKCHSKGFKCLAAPTGEEGLELARLRAPSAIILDLHLPGVDGWTVLRALKEDIRTRHIPVHIVSGEEASTEAIRMGAVGHATKPLDLDSLEETFRRLEQVSSKKTWRVLVVEDNAEIRRETLRTIKARDVTVDEAETGEEALEALRSENYDCVILDLGLPGMDGLEILKILEEEGIPLPPVIVHTARNLTREEEADLREYAESIVIKDVRSRERLLDEVSLFLHRVVSEMPRKNQKIIRDLHDADAILKDVKVLVVDDDMRTTFAMSRLLSSWGMKPLKADNGERALHLLNQEPDISLVLMDIMMPVMDGYEAMKRIRAQDRFRSLPIIALTAKAMPEDREKCVSAGANDYLSKPVDQERLISMLRVWLRR